MTWESWEKTVEKGPGPLAVRCGCFLLACFLVVGTVSDQAIPVKSVTINIESVGDKK